MTLPDGPVGLPIGVPEPKAAVPFEPRPPRLLEQQANNRRVRNDVIAMQNSLSPPSLPARTAAPPAERDRRGRRGGFWVTAGLLRGVIAVAGFVGVRNGAEQQQHAAGAGVATQPLPVEAVQAAPAPQPAPAVAPAAPAQPAAEAAPVQLPAITMEPTKPVAP